MLKSSRDAIEILGDLKPDEIAADMVRSRALVNCFTEIGEAASRLSEEARERVADVPWRQVVGMRNIIVHMYWGIDWGEIVSTVRSDLPRLIAGLEPAISEWPESAD